MTTAPFRMSRIGRHSLIYGIGIVAGKSVAFFMLPIYTRYLTPADYGVLQLITLTLEVVSIFTGARIGQGIFHFYHKAQSREERRQVMFTALALLAATYVLGSTGMYLAAPVISDIVFEARGDYVTYVRIAAASLAFQSLVLVPMAYLRLRDQSKMFVTVSLSKLFLQVILNLILLIPLQMGVMGVLIATLSSQVAMGLVLTVYLVRDVGIEFSAPAARDFVRFGLPLVAMQIASVTLTFGDRYVLSKAGDMTAVGIYGVAYQFGLILLTLGYLPFSRIWYPIRFEVARRPDRDEVYSRVFIYINIVLVSMALLLALFSGDFLRLIAHPAFHSAAPLIPAIVLAYLLQAWMSFLNIGVLITERTELFSLATWVAAGVAVAGYLILIPPLLAWGAALTTIAAMGVRLAIVYVLGQRLWPIRYKWAPIWRLLIVAAVVYLAAMSLPRMGVVMSMLLRIVLFAFYVAAIWSIDILSARDREVIRRSVRQPVAAFSRLMGRSRV